MVSCVHFRSLRSLSLALAIGAAASACAPMAEFLVQPALAPPVYRSVRVTAPTKAGAPDASKYVQTATASNVPVRSSKVVININTDVRQRIFCAERPTSAGCARPRSSAQVAAEDQANAIETTAFVSDTERQLEKELIKRGFRVINRARLEAKLREMRDSRDDCKNALNALSPGCLQELPDEARGLIATYEAERRAGRLSDVDFAVKVQEVRSRFQYASAGRKRDDNEMVDVSEVMRAAKDGEVGADFILLINGFRYEPVATSYNLNHFSEVRELAAADPAMADWLNSNGTISCEQWSVQLDASLIHVRSGEVVWIGEHRVSENMLAGGDEDAIEITVSSDRRVSNEHAVVQAIDDANSDIGRRRRANDPDAYAIPAPTYGFRASARVTSGTCMKNGEGAQPPRDTLARLTEFVAGQLMSTIQTSTPKA